MVDEVKSLGLRTNLFLHRREGTVTARDGYLVVHTPDNPDYWFGNSLVMPGPPPRGALPDWEAKHVAAHPAAQHRVFQCDGTDGSLGDSGAFESAGYKLDRMEVLTSTAIVDNGKLTSEFELRHLSGDEDWRQALGLRMCIAVQDEGRSADSHMAFERSQLRFRRSMVSDGLASWHGAFEGARLVASLGLVGQGDFARFQMVETHPEFRRRGICSSLVSHAAKLALLEHPDRPLVMLAVEGYHARNIYGSLGFATTERVLSLVREPAQ